MVNDFVSFVIAAIVAVALCLLAAMALSFLGIGWV